ncbi:hypothetical protein GRI89_15850 [Altererythrobacter salegens]|uniref:DUF2214 domain-containing protein n=1 Tax=Croceibacterium salegens TaxID=1737568 RepID=A0A6I4T148_9SPHN|nr:hypothetical protein [Croceibacterium salegens]MXO61016.1 hypothetical protein [Croceibacterium salegens]
MANPTIWENVQNSSLGLGIAESEWWFPTIETVHVIALVTVVGVIAAMDLRLLGLTSRGKSVVAMERDTVPLVWGAFVLALVTGTLLFVSKAATYMANPFFLWKMGLMALAGVNMAIFHRVLSQGVDEWGQPGHAIPMAAKVSGVVSLVLWMLIPLCGRIVGFTLGVYYS